MNAAAVGSTAVVVVVFTGLGTIRAKNHSIKQHQLIDHYYTAHRSSSREVSPLDEYWIPFRPSSYSTLTAAVPSKPAHYCMKRCVYDICIQQEGGYIYIYTALNTYHSIVCTRVRLPEEEWEACMHAREYTKTYIQQQKQYVRELRVTAVSYKCRFAVGLPTVHDWL